MQIDPRIHHIIHLLDEAILCSLLDKKSAIGLYVIFDGNDIHFNQQDIIDGLNK